MFLLTVSGSTSLNQFNKKGMSLHRLWTKKDDPAAVFCEVLDLTWLCNEGEGVTFQSSFQINLFIV